MSARIGQNEIQDFDGIAVCFALMREATPFLKTCRSARRIAGCPFPVWLTDLPTSTQKTVLVLTPGVGHTRINPALDWLWARTKSRLIVSAGFAGGLHESMAVGDVVVPGTIVDDASEWSACFGAPNVRLYGAEHLIVSPQEKRQIAHRFGTIAVDMESATIARRCLNAGVPFAVIRAVSDTIDTTLSPRLTELLSGGEVSPLRVAWNCLRFPRLVSECIRLAKHTTLAARNLAVALRNELSSR